MITAISMAAVAFIAVIFLVFLFIKLRRRYRMKKYCTRPDGSIVDDCEKLISNPPKSSRKGFFSRRSKPKFEPVESLAGDNEPFPFQEKIEVQRPPPARIPPPAVQDIFDLPMQQTPTQPLTRSGIFHRYENSTALTMPRPSISDINQQQQQQPAPGNLDTRRPSVNLNGSNYTPLSPPRQVRRKLVQYGYLSGGTDDTAYTAYTGVTGTVRQPSLDSLFSELSGTIPSFLVTEGGRSWKSSSQSASEGTATGNRNLQSPDSGPGMAPPSPPGMAERNRNRVSEITPEGVLEQMIADNPARRSLNGSPPLSRKQTFGDLLGPTT